MAKVVNGEKESMFKEEGFVRINLNNYRRRSIEGSPTKANDLGARRSPGRLLVRGTKLPRLRR